MGGDCGRTHPAHFSVVVVALVFACLRQTPPKLCHFDRSCSQPHREQRSGETRFFTHAIPPPRHRPCSCRIPILCSCCSCSSSCRDLLLQLPWLLGTPRFQLLLLSQLLLSLLFLSSPKGTCFCLIAYRAVERSRILLCSLLSASILLIIVTPLSAFIRARLRSRLFGPLKVLTKLGGFSPWGMPTDFAITAKMAPSANHACHTFHRLLTTKHHAQHTISAKIQQILPSTTTKNPHKKQRPRGATSPLTASSP